MLKTLKHQTFNLTPRPGGEIGRRTVFRWQHPKGCAGSNPVPGTEPRKSGFVFFKNYKAKPTISFFKIMF